MSSIRTPPMKDPREVIVYKAKRLAGEGGLVAPYTVHVEINVDPTGIPARCHESGRRVLISPT